MKKKDKNYVTNCITTIIACCVALFIVRFATQQLLKIYLSHPGSYESNC